MSWENAVQLYKACNDNKTFQDNIQLLYRICASNHKYNVKPGNSSSKLTLSFDDDKPLEEMIKTNSFIAFRPGNVESSFVYRSLTGEFLKSWHFDMRNEIDFYIKRNAGLYYSQVCDREKVHKWYIDNFIELLRICTPTLAVCFAQFDLPLLSQLDITTTCYNYGRVWRILLENIGGKTLLYIGNAVKSIEYAKSVGLNNIWKFHVDDFNLKCVKTPQTTSGSRNFPHNNMIETTENILNEIERVGHFDCVILGCGAYGAPLINEIRKRYTNTNIVYLGSDCFKMFGILTPKMRWDLSQEEAINIGRDVQYSHDSYVHYNKDYSVWVQEDSEDYNHPEPKYWK